MATAFSSLRGRLFALLFLALLLLALPLAFLSAREAEGAASEDLRRALYTRLYLLGEEGPGEEEALLLELFRLAQVYGGGTGFVIGKEGVAFTEVPSPNLPPGLLEALAQGRAYQGVWRGVLYVALPRGEGGFGLAVPLEGVAGLGRRLLLLYATWGGGVLLAIFLLSALGLAWALRPLGQLAKLLEARRPEDLSPLPDPGLAELRPLVEALNSRLAQVEGLLRELSEKEESARRFARHASHELRNPLAALKGYLEVLLRKPEPRALAGALREAERMEALLSGLGPSGERVGGDGRGTSGDGAPILLPDQRLFGRGSGRARAGSFFEGPGSFFPGAGPGVFGHDERLHLSGHGDGLAQTGLLEGSEAGLAAGGVGGGGGPERVAGVVGDFPRPHGGPGGACGDDRKADERQLFLPAPVAS